MRPERVGLGAVCRRVDLEGPVPAQSFADVCVLPYAVFDMVVEMRFEVGYRRFLVVDRRFSLTVRAVPRDPKVGFREPVGEVRQEVCFDGGSYSSVVF